MLKSGSIEIDEIIAFRACCRFHQKHLLEAWEVILILPREPIAFLVGELLDGKLDFYGEIVYAQNVRYGPVHVGA